MSIISLLTTVVNSLSPVPAFYYNTKAQQNIKADNENTANGAIYLTFPVYSENDIEKAGYIKEIYPLNIYFFKASDMNNTAMQHQTILDAMRLLANTFLIKCQTLKDANGIYLFEQKFKYKIIDDINVFDLNATGCVLEIRLQPKLPVIICP